MAESYANLFGTNGSGRQNRIGSLFGQQRSQTQPGQTPTQQPQQAQRTFAQMQQQGQARPAPQAPQAQTYQPFQGSQQAQQARTQLMQNLQQQLAQPTRFDTQAFQQMRQAQQANLQSEFAEQQRQLNEDLARRGLSASTIGAAGLGRLQGAQSRALADLDAQLLQQAAQTQAQDRLAALQAGGQFAELAGAQDLAEFEARRVGQAQQFQEGLAAAQFGQGQSEFDRRMALEAAQAEQQGGMSAMDLALRQQLGIGGLDIQQQEVGLRAQQLQQQVADAAAERQLREALQTRELTAQEQQQLRDITARQQLQTQELGARREESQAERDIRLRLQEGQITAEQAQQERALAAQQQQFGQQLAFNREELALRGDLGRAEQQLAERRLAQEGRLEEARQALQGKELGQREQQFAQDLALRGELGRGQLTQEQQRFQLQLAAALSALKPEQIAAFRAQMGTGFPRTTVSTATGGGTPYPTGGTGTGTGTGNEIIPGSTDIPMAAYDTSLSELLRNMYGF